jgi:hypothetical protein
MDKPAHANVSMSHCSLAMGDMCYTWTTAETSSASHFPTASGLYDGRANRSNWFCKSINDSDPLPPLRALELKVGLPIMKQLGWPTILCHQLEVASDGSIANYKLRQSNQKQHAVSAFKSLNYRVIAAGDSFNDTTMLGEADVGFFFHAPESIKRQFPHFGAYDEYAELTAAIKGALV